MDIDKLEAGPELDALIEKYIMKRDLSVIPETCPNCGGYVSQNRDPGWCGSCCTYVNKPKPYSSNIAVAWIMEERVAQRGLIPFYTEALFNVIVKEYRITDLANEITDFLMIHATPLQRCKAALKAVMENA